MTTHISYLPPFLKEFRSLKLEMLIKDLHKMNYEELKKVKEEIEDLLYMEEAK